MKITEKAPKSQNIRKKAQKMTKSPNAKLPNKNFQPKRLQTMSNSRSFEKKIPSLATLNVPKFGSGPGLGYRQTTCSLLIASALWFLLGELWPRRGD